MRRSVLFETWASVAPDVNAIGGVMDKTAALLRAPYDWSDEVAALAVPVLLVFGDADSVPTAYAAEFFALLDGGLRDAGWDGSTMGSSRLAILPGRNALRRVRRPRVRRHRRPLPSVMGRRRGGRARGAAGRRAQPGSQPSR